MSDIPASESARFLQSQTLHSILTILYLFVLTLCFVVPTFFYCWLQCHDQESSQQTRIEDADIAMTVRASVEEQSETRAMRKKYRAERRARIVQLLSPVSIVSLYNVCKKNKCFVGANCALLFFPPKRFSEKSTFIVVKTKSKEKLKRKATVQ
jgi:hypothetical protein